MSHDHHNHSHSNVVSIEDIVGEKSSGFKNWSLHKTLDGIRQHKAHNGVQLEGMKRIAELTEEEKNCLSIAKEEDGIKDILIATQTFAYDPKLINYAFCALGNIYLQLPSQSKHETKFTREAIGTITIIMKSHVTNTGIQCYGCYAIAGISLDNDAIGIIAVEREAPAAILEAMRKHEANAFLQTNAITAIENLCKNSDERKSIFQKEGAVELIEKALKTFSRDEEVVSTGLRTLRNIFGVNKES